MTRTVTGHRCPHCGDNLHADVKYSKEVEYQCLGCHAMFEGHVEQSMTNSGQAYIVTGPATA